MLHDDGVFFFNDLNSLIYQVLLNISPRTLSIGIFPIVLRKKTSSTDLAWMLLTEGRSSSNLPNRVLSAACVVLTYSCNNNCVSSCSESVRLVSRRPRTSVKKKSKSKNK